MRKGLALFMLSLAVILAGCGGGGGGSDPSLQTAVVDLSHDNGNGYGFGDSVGGEERRYQTFIAPDYPVVTAVEVRIRKLPDSGTYSTIRVELYATNEAGAPTGQSLAEGLIPHDWLDDSFKTVKAGLFYDGLTAGRQYAVILTQGVLSEAHYEWCAGEDPTPGLHFGKYTGVWGDESGFGDGWLKVHLASARPPVTRIFIYAAAMHNGDLKDEYDDARAGADAIAAQRPFFLAGKTVHAFISISAADCIANMPANYGFPADVPIVSVLDETIVVADRWSDLLDGGIKTELNEALGLSGPWIWWSGSLVDGNYDTAYNCGGWTSTGFGMIGVTNSVAASWIHHTGASGISNYYVLGIAY